MRTLTVLVDEDGIVTKHHFYQSKLNTYQGAASASFGKKIDPEKLAKIQTGTTTRAQVVQALGAPHEESLNTGGNLVMEWVHADVNAVGGVTQVTHVQIVLDENETVETVKTYRDN